MIIKTTHNIVTPTHDDATNMMAVFADTNELPVAMKFVNKGEIADIIKTLTNMLASDSDDIMTIKPNKFEMDGAKFIEDFNTTKSEAELIEFKKPEPPKAKPMQAKTTKKEKK